MSNIPDDLRYSETHTWCEQTEGGLLRIGITDYAQTELGDIVYVELPEIERIFNAGDECAVVESVKSASDVYCPVTGEVVEVNHNLEDEPEKINEDPYNDGWLFILRPENEGEVDELMDADEYKEMIEE